eukprot:TRINITY_DN19546_c0_g1_i1.p1 TRINITY_DN19546_c0_g1~~TRINITY_DN19546_c0_g1_i1.p1  ORF type:complete len:315 (-),score=34.06 TRINITY_DN19546_c0_g1_i1:215-1159(-)
MAEATSEPDDQHFFELAFRLKDQVQAPSQSNFRVFCIATFDRDGKTDYVIGSNSECTSISNGICAEKSALSKLRELGYADQVLKLYLTCDGHVEITPGPLCREFLSDFLQPDTPIILLWRNSSAEIHSRVTNLAQLFPHPCIYASLRAPQAEEFATSFVRGMHTKPSVDCLIHAGVEEQVWTTLYDRLLALCSKDGRSRLHWLQLAAGVIFTDGSVEVSWQTKSLEYVPSLDPISKLSWVLERAQERGVVPRCLLQVDQHGVLHAPNGRARSYLFENGFSYVVVFVHTPQGQIVTATAAELLPDAPKIEEIFGF